MLGFTFFSLIIYLIAIALLWGEGNYQTFVAEMGVTWASGIIIIIFIILILNLILLHVYLNYLGMTTYDFLTQDKKKVRTQSFNSI
jgi:succinate dehydrogenase hydrophobic anchor subunit